MNAAHAIRVNYHGAVNTYKWARSKNAHYIFSSTDKAVLPVNTYGIAKAMAERYLMSHGLSTVYRWGNICGSRGSVLPIIKDCIQAGKPFVLTHPEMTRFWAHIADVAMFMWNNKDEVTRDEPHIPDNMKAAPLMKLLKVMGCDNIEVGSIRPGEKIHEVLRTGHDWCLRSDDPSIQYTDDELKALVARCL